MRRRLAERDEAKTKIANFCTPRTPKRKKDEDSEGSDQEASPSQKFRRVRFEEDTGGTEVKPMTDSNGETQDQTTREVKHALREDSKDPHRVPSRQRKCSGTERIGGRGAKINPTYVPTASTATPPTHLHTHTDSTHQRNHQKENPEDKETGAQ